jgi:predicted transcriptional regulator
MSQAIKKAKEILALNETVELAKSILAPRERFQRAKARFTKKEAVPQDMPAIQAKSSLLEKETNETQHESKLTVCVEVLCTLVANGPMRVTQLKRKFSMDEAHLLPILRLLWNRGLVEEEQIGTKEARYTVTERGQKMLKVMGPILKEAHKAQLRDYETLSTALSGAGYI